MKQCKHFLLTIAVLLCSISVNAQIVASGSCGENLTWTLSEQGELTIKGVGEMYNYLSLKETPWYDKKGSISRIFIEEGVTSIGDNAFAHCYLLRSITIPESLVAIGTDAFKDTNALNRVFNYSNLKGSEILNNRLNMNEYVNIDNFLFYTTEDGIHHLEGYIGEDTDIIFPSDYNGGSYQVGSFIFQHPDCIVSVTITKGVENLDALTFDGCSNLTSIVVQDDNTKYDSRENCNAVIETESNTLILGCSTTSFPRSVTSIAANAFYGCRNLTSILIPKTITEIPSGGLFFGCNSLTSVVVEEGNPKYDSRNNCNAIIETSSNTLIAGCSATIIPEDVERIGTQAFFGRRNLTSIEIPKGVTVLGWWSFAFCDNLTSIVIPSSVTSLSNSVFWNCCSLTSITCNMELPYPIDYYAFAGVDKSIPVYVPAGSAEAYQSAEYWSEFTNYQPLSSDIASGTCGDNLTWRLTEEYELIIEGEGAMYDYQRSIFGNTEVWEETKDTVDTPWYVFRESIEKVMLGEGVVSIGAYAFYNCSNLTAIKIPKEIVEIGYGALGNCVKLTSIEVSEKNTIYDSREDCNAIIETSCDSLVVGCLTTIIPNSVKVIGQCAFYGTPLTSISIPNGVERIYANGFYKCLLLETIFIPATVESIHDMAFVLCKSLRSIVIDSENPIYTSGPNNSYIMEKGSKTLMTGTTKGDIPEGVEHIGRYAFAGRNLGHIHIPDEVISLENCAFLGSSITSIRIPASLTYIGNQAFGGSGRIYFCNKLEAVYIEHLESWLEIDFSGAYSSPLYFAKNLYLNGEKLETLEIPESVTILKKYVFDGWNGTEIIIPNDSKLASIDSYAFAFDGISCLTAITCHKTAPPVAFFESFSGVDKSIPVFVPAESVNIYNAAKGWSEFTNIQPLSNEYTLTVSSAGYATMYLGYAAAIPDDVKVYIASNVEGDRLMMTEVEGVLPANTGVIVRAKAGTYAFVESDGAPANVEGNLLSGTATDTYITAESGYRYYVLAQKEGVVGMYRPKLTDGQFLNNANKAYLALDLGNLGIFDDEVDTGEEGGQLSNRLRFDFGGTTDIEKTIDKRSSLAGGKSNGGQTTVVYDLQGRRVEKPTKPGIYIVNGKKVIFK